jgi:hypothetical protein
MMHHIATAHAPHAARAAQPRRDTPLWVMLVAFIALTIFFAWLDRVDREYTAELAADAVMRRLRNGES